MNNCDDYVWVGDVIWDMVEARRGWEELVIKMSVAMVHHKLSSKCPPVDCVTSEAPTHDTGLDPDWYCDTVTYWTRGQWTEFYTGLEQQSNIYTPIVCNNPKNVGQNQSLFLAVCVKSFIVFLSDYENEIFWLQKIVKQAKYSWLVGPWSRF